MTCSKSKAVECVQLLGMGEGSSAKSAIYALRRKALDVIHRILPDPEAALLAGILLGIETGIPEPVLEDFRQTGTSHIIAICGFNFAIISGLLVVCVGTPVWTLAQLAAGVAWNRRVCDAGRGERRGGAGSDHGEPVGVCDADWAAVERAEYADRGGRLDGALQPHVLWDVSFQLSFMATVGLILYAEPLTEAFVRLALTLDPKERARRLAAPLGDYLLFTIAAQLTTLPLIVYYFHQAPMISFLVNPLILPAQPALMVLGGVKVVFGLIAVPLGKVFGLLVWPLLAYTIRVVEAFSGSSGRNVAAQPGERLAGARRLRVAVRMDAARRKAD